MTIRKYLFSPRVIGSAFGVLGVAKATRRPDLGQRNWVLWLAWAGSLVVAITTVRQDSARRVGAQRP